MAREKSSEWDQNLHKKVDMYNLVKNLDMCLACGKCVGICPVAKISPSYNSRQIIRDVLMGKKERWLQSEEIWQCFWCANCYTVCPMDIHFPLLMMQIRYRAVEEGYGVKYILPFKRFTLRAIEDGLTFAPAKAERREKIKRLRSKVGLPPWPEISEKARAEYKALFEITGAKEWVEKIKEEAELPVRFTYQEGKIIREKESC